MNAMSGYYTTTAQIRYYGQLPTAVGKTPDGVWGAGVSSKVWGKNIIAAADWTELLDDARKEAFDLSRKKEPVHERLANMALDVDSLYAFTRSWGFLDADDMEDHEGRIITRLHHVQPLQLFLQRAWKNEMPAIARMEKDVKARVDVHAKGIDIAVIDLWNLVRLSFLRDYKAGRTKVCTNPDCPTPYFLQQRKGQQYCSHKCAVLMNVRRFRQRQTTRQQSVAQPSTRSHSKSKKGESR